jgi:D-glycero-alpha-D-manno-heptose 1-phosphate guanylyltransferase
MIKECVILAGGLGTRLRSVVPNIPKALAVVNGAPFLHYLFTYLHQAGITHIVISVGHLHQMIEEYCHEWKDKLHIRLAIEYEPLGTGGGIKNALSICNSNNVLIINGDTFFNIDLKIFEQQFLAQPQIDLAIALKPMQHFDRYGIVHTNEANQIIGFAEKQPREDGNINGGVYIIRKNVFDEYVFPEKFSFETDFMNTHYSFLHFYGFVHHNYFIDIGIPQDYETAQIEIPRLFKTS